MKTSVTLLLAVPVWVLALLTSCPAEDAPKESPKQVHERMSKAYRDDDFAAWRNLLVPREEADEQAEFDREIKRSSETGLKSLADKAGITVEQLKSLKVRDYWEKYFHHTLAPESAMRDKWLYMDAIHAADSPDTFAEAEWITSEDKLVNEIWRLVNGEWRFVSQFDKAVGETPPGWPPKAVCESWRQAVSGGDGLGLFQLYSRDIRSKYFRTWGPELGKLQEADEATRTAAEKEIDMKPGALRSTGVVRFIERRLTARLADWMKQPGNEDKIRHMTFGAAKIDGKKATCPIEDSKDESLGLDSTGGSWLISSDFLDAGRAKLGGK